MIATSPIPRDSLQRWRGIGDYFRLSVVLLLLLVAALKLDMLATGAAITLEKDPIIGLSFYGTYGLAAAVEIATALTLVLFRSKLVGCYVLILVASALLAYRAGLWMIDYKLPCSCLGVLPGWLGLSRPGADSVARLLLSYFLAVGFGGLFVYKKP